MCEDPPSYWLRRNKMLNTTAHGICTAHQCSIPTIVTLYPPWCTTVNPEIFATILFSRIALQEIIVTLKFRD